MRSGLFIRADLRRSVGLAVRRAVDGLLRPSSRAGFRHPRRQLHFVEPLESRQYLTTVTLTGPGTGGTAFLASLNSTTGNIDFFVNGSPGSGTPVQSVAASSVSSVVIDDAGSGDTLTINAARAAFAVDASGTSALTMVVNQGAVTLSATQSLNNVEVAAGGSLTLAGNVTLNALTVDGSAAHASGTLTANILNVDSNYTDSGGAIASGITINNASTFTANFAGSLAGIAGTFNNDGTFVENLASGSMISSDFIFNNPGGTIDLIGPGTLSLANSIVVPNGSSLTIEGAGTLSMPMLDDVDAAITQQGGTLNLAGNLDVGDGTRNAVYTLSGGTINAPVLYIGGDPSSLGTPTTGSFVQNGGVVNATTLVQVGDGNSDIGSYTLTAGAINANREEIGDSSTGSFTQTGGNVTIAGRIDMGLNGYATLDQRGGIETCTDFSIGSLEGASTYSLSGGTMSASTMSIGTYGHGELDLSGTGSLQIPFEVVGCGGVGTLDQTGGTNYVSYGLEVGLSDGAVGNAASGRYSLSGGTLTAVVEVIATDAENNGSGTQASVTGTFSQSGGVNTVTDIALAMQANATGVYNLSGGTLDADAMSDGYLYANTASASFNQSGGLASFSGYVIVGNQATGQLNLTGGSITVAQTLYVGYDATGTLTDSGGWLTVGGNLYVTGDGTFGDAAGFGILNLNGTGNVEASEIFVGYSGAATLNQSGGTLGVSSYLVLDGPSGTIGTYNYSAGSQPTAAQTIDVLKPTAGGPSVVNEGSPYTLTLSATTNVGTNAITAWNIAWGDSTANTSLSGSPPPSSAQHTYVTGPNTYTINATASGGGDSFPSSPQSVVVNDVPATVASPATLTVNAGSLLSFSTTWTDPGSNETHTASILWGDGSSSPMPNPPTPGTVTLTQSGNNGTVSGTHVYEQYGEYTAMLTITDSGGAVGQIPIAIHVNYVPPTFTAVAPTAPIVSNQPVTLQLNDYGPDTTGVKTWTINWNDRTSPTVINTETTPPNASNTTLSTWEVSHSYAEDGVFEPTVSASDSVATYSVAVLPSTITISNAPPTPTHLAVTSISGTENYVTWVDVAGSSAYYTINRSTGASSPQVVASVVAGTTAFLDSGLSTNTTYTYFVTATNSFGTSPTQSQGLSATTGPTDTTGYYRITNVGTVTSSNSGEAPVVGQLGAVNSGWVVAGSAMGAMLGLIRGELTVPSNGGVFDSGLSGAFLPTPEGFSFDESYGLINGGYVYDDDTIPITVQESPIPINPGSIAATAIGTGEIDITWTPAAGQIDGYNVYRYVPYPDGGGSWQRLNSGSATTVVGTATIFRDVGLTPGTTYNYCVTSKYNGIESAMNQAIGGDASATTLVARVDAPSVIAAYEYVYNNVNVELYAGSMKGAEATDETKSGNDWDQAQLLVEKLNSLGGNQPATFGYGRIETTYDAVRQWLGLSATLPDSGIYTLLSAAGLSPVDVAGSIEFDHAWVDVNLGTAGTIGLDPSWKQTQIAAGVTDAIAADSNDPATDLSFLASGETPYQYFQSQLSTCLASKGAGEGIGDVPTRGEIERKVFSQLPAKLPYTVVQSAGPFTSVPDMYKARERVTITQAGNQLYSYEMSLPDDPTKSLSFHSDGTDFHLLVDTFNSGGILSTDDIEMPVTAGSSAPVQITVEHYDSGYDMSSPTPDESKYHINSYTRNPADWSVVVVNADQTSTLFLQHVQAEIASIDDGGDAKSNLGDVQAILAARLTLLLDGLTYFSDLNAQRDQLADELHVMPVIAHAESAVVTGTGNADGTGGILQQWQKNIPFPVQFQRSHIDAANVGNGSRVYEPTDPAVSPSELSEITSLIEANASSLESSSLQEVTSSQAMSTIKGFEWAAQETGTGPVVWSPGGVVPPVFGTLPQSIQFELMTEHNIGFTLVMPTIAIVIPTTTPDDPKWSGFVWISESPAAYDVDGQAVRRFALMRDTDSAPEFGGDTFDPSADDSANTPTPVSPWGDTSSGFDAATGESTRDETDVSIPNVVPVTFTRHYDSFQIPELTSDLLATQEVDDANNHLVDEGLGLGWTYSYGDFLYFDEGSGAATLCSSDGTRRTFAANPSETGTFVSPGGDYGSLTMVANDEGLKSYVYSATNGETFTFSRLVNSDIAKLQSQSDSNGNTVICQYNGADLLDAVTDSEGHILLSFSWYGAGVLGANVSPHISSVTAGGQIWTYYYVLISDGIDTGTRVSLSEVNSPQVSENPQGMSAVDAVAYTYYGELPSTESDADHLALWGLLETVTQPDGGTRLYDYYADRQVSEIVDSKSFGSVGQTANGIDLNGRSEVTTQTVESASYDTLSHTTTSIDADGNVTLTTFTPDGHPSRTQLPDGSEETQVWSGMDDVGVFRGNSFRLDQDGSDGAFSPEKDTVYNFGSAGDYPLIGDWNGMGRSEIGVWDNGTFYLDMNGDGVYEPGTDPSFSFGGSGDIPIVGDWTGNGVDGVGYFDPSTGVFYEKLDGFAPDDSQVLEISTGYTGAYPVIGDWDGIGRSELGLMDVENSTDVFHLLGPNNLPEGNAYPFGPASGHDIPVSGYFAPGNVSDFGVFRQDTDGDYQFVLDSNGNRVLDSEPGIGTPYAPDADLRISMGVAGDRPFAGDWSEDGSRNLLEVSQDAIGRVTRSTFDAQGNIIRQISPDGLETDTTYLELYTISGDWERPLQVVIQGRDGVQSRVTTLSYQPGETGNVLWSDDPAGNVTLMSYDSYGRLQTLTKPNGVDTSTNPGSPQEKPDGSSYTTTYLYAIGAAGQYTSLVSGQTIGSTAELSTYDAFGRLISSSDGTAADNGVPRDTTYYYNALGELLTTSVPDPTGAGLPITDSETYAGGELVDSEDGRGYTTRYIYDSLGRRVSTTAPDGSSTSVEYNNDGNVIATIDELGNVTQYFYDSRNRLIQTIYADGSSTRELYDSASRVTAKSDALGQISTTQYNAEDRVTTQTSPTPGGDSINDYDRAPLTVMTTYNDLGVLTNQDATGTTHYTRDLDGRPLSTIREWSGTIISASSSTYDNDGNLTSTTVYDAMGALLSQAGLSSPTERTTSYAYDGMDRKVLETDPAPGDGEGLPAPETEWTYDNSGNIVDTVQGVATAAGSLAPGDNLQNETVYEFDSLNRVTLTATGRRNAVAAVSPSGGLTFTLSSNGLENNDVILIRYFRYIDNPDGSVTQIRVQTLVNVSVIDSNTFTDQNNVIPASIVVPGLVDVFTSTESTRYDNDGNVIATTDSHGNTTSFAYDCNNRKVMESEATFNDGSADSSTPVIRWSYDAAGNILSETDPRGNVTTLSYDDMNRRVSQMLPGADNNPYTPDDPTTTYTYDADGRPLSTTDALGRVDFTIYDNLGRSVASAEGGSWALVSGSGTTVTVTLPQYQFQNQQYVEVSAGVEGLPAGEYQITSLDANHFSIQVENAESIQGRVAISQYWTTTVYLQNGRIQYTSDMLRRIQTFDYDIAGNCIAIRRAYATIDGSTITNTPSQTSTVSQTFDSFGNVLTSTSPLGNAAGVISSLYTTTYTYDALNRKQTEVGPAVNLNVTDPQRILTTWSYDALGRVFEVTQENESTYTTYDVLNRPLINASGIRSDATATGGGSDNPTVTVTMTDHGFVTGDQVFLFASEGLWGGVHVITVIDSNHFTFVDTPAAGTMDFSAVPLSVASTFTITSYDVNGNVTSVTDSRGFTTNYTYDQENRKTSQSNVPNVSTAASVTSFAYDVDGNIISTTDPLGQTTTYTYDNLNRKISESLPSVYAGTPSTYYSYDLVGNLATVTDPRGAVTSYGYDVLNRKVREQDANPGDNAATDDSPITTWSYDADGNVISTVSPRGNANPSDAVAYTTFYSYDNRNEQTSVTWLDANGSTFDSTSSTYDVAGNVISTTDALGDTTSYGYDGLNRRISEREPSPTGTAGGGPLLVWGYDDYGNVISTQDALGRESFTVYDSSNRPIFSGQNSRVGSVAGSGNVVTVTLQSHGFSTGDRLLIAGNSGIPEGIYVVTVTNANTLTFVVPNLNAALVVGAAQVAGFTSATSYDTNGNVVSTTDSLGRVTTYVYDGMNRKTAMIQPSNADGTRGPTTTYFYDLDSRLTGVVDPIGNTSNDPTFQAQHLTQTTYDADGNKTSVLGPFFNDVPGSVDRPDTSYQYDLDGNVTAVTVYTTLAAQGDNGAGEPSGGETTAFGYDMLGRKTVEVQSDPSNGSAYINDPNAPKTFYTYDVAGNLTSVLDPRGSATGADPSQFLTTYVYDSRNRKIEQTVADADGNGTPAITTYAYNAAGELTSTVDPLGNIAGGTPSLHETNYFYDAWGRKIAEQSPPSQPSAAAATTWYVYDADGNLTATIDPLGAQALGFAPSNDPTSAQSAAIAAMVAGYVHSTSYVYDAENRKVAEIDADPDPTNGSTADVPLTTFGYDMAGELIWTTSPDGNSLATTNVTAPTPGALYTTTYAYDPQGRKIMEIDPDPDGAGPLQPSVTRFGYDPNGNLVYTIDPNGNAYIAQQSNPLATEMAIVVANHFDTTETVYDNDNRPIEVDEANSTGNPASGVVPKTLYQYDSAGNVTWVTDADGNVTRYTYDLLNRQVVEYIFFSNSAHAGDVVGNNTEFATSTYDLDGNLISHTDHNETVTSSFYNPANELVEQTATTSGGTPVVTELASYDVMGRLVNESDGESNYSYTYDALGRVLSVTSQLSAPGGPVVLGADMTPSLAGGVVDFDGGASLPAGDYRVEYISGSVNYGDGQGYRVNGEGYFLISYPGGGTQAPGTSATGLTAAQAQAQSVGEFVDIQSNGGPIGVSLDEPGYNSSYPNTAGSNGAPTFRLVSLSPVPGSGSGGTYGTTYTYSYDVAGRQTGTTAVLGATVDHTEAFTYDDLNRLVSQTQDASGTPELKVTYTYDPSGQLLAEQRYQGGTGVIYSQSTYDDAGRLTQLRHTYGLGPGGGNIDTYNLTYDADDRLTVFSSSADGTAIYSYDANGQLLQTTGTAANPAGEDYDYDPEGNRIVDDDVTGNDSDIGPDNRLLQAGDVSYTYDGNGNRLTSLNITTRNYSVKGGSGGMGAYDYRNRLTSITTTGPTPTDGSTQPQDTAIYTYDVENKRIGREVIDQADDSAPTLEEAYGYDQGQLSLVIDATAAGGNSSGPSEPVTFALAERIMQTPGDPDHPLADVNVRTGAVTWLLGDEQGSIRDSVTNGSDTHVDFDSYGNVIGTNQPKRFGYTGHEQDAESGLVYMSARYYDPSTGTFISQDPTGFGSGDTNLYRYTGNSPTNRTDPTGESWLSSFLDNVLGIDKGKIFGISDKTFLGQLLEGPYQIAKSSLQGTKDGFEGDWNGVDNSLFNAGYYGTGPGYLIAQNTPIHSVGADFGFASIGISYDPGTGLRSIDASYDGAYIQQSENGHGGLETYLGVHYGPFTAAGSVDHWKQGFGEASFCGFNVGISSNAQGQFGASAGVDASLGYGGASISADYGVSLNYDGEVTTGWNYSGGYAQNLRNPDYNTAMISGPGYSVADTAGRWEGSVLGGAFTDYDPSYLMAYREAVAEQTGMAVAEADGVNGYAQPSTLGTPAGPYDPPQPNTLVPRLRTPPAGSLPPPHSSLDMSLVALPDDGYSALDSAPAVSMPMTLNGEDPNAPPPMVGVTQDATVPSPGFNLQGPNAVIGYQSARFKASYEAAQAGLTETPNVVASQWVNGAASFMEAINDPYYPLQVGANLINSASRLVIGNINSIASSLQQNARLEDAVLGYGDGSAPIYQLPNPDVASGKFLENYNNAFNNGNAISFGSFGVGVVAPAVIGGIAAPTEAATQGFFFEPTPVQGSMQAYQSTPVMVGGTDAFVLDANSIRTPYGQAFQSSSTDATAALDQVQSGVTIYKGGVLGRSEAAGSQFLSLENPMNLGYAGRYGIPPQNNGFDFILSGTVEPGAPVITRAAPGIPPNPGGGIEAVVNPGSFRLDSFYMP